jgi:hypothetical protein
MRVDAFLHARLTIIWHIVRLGADVCEISNYIQHLVLRCPGYCIARGGATRDLPSRTFGAERISVEHTFLPYAAEHMELSLDRLF